MGLAGDHDRFGAVGFGFEFGPSRHVGIPFDQGRGWADALNGVRKEVPDDPIDRPVVRVDQKGATRFVDLARITGEMDLPDMREWVALQLLF